MKKIYNEILTKYPKYFPATTAVHKEQLSGTDARISCKITGLTRQLDDVKWTKSDNSAIMSGQDGYIVDKGDFSDGSQTTTLTVPAAQNEADSTYRCLITAAEWVVKDRSTVVMLNVFSKFGDAFNELMNPFGSPVCRSY